MFVFVKKINKKISVLKKSVSILTSTIRSVMTKPYSAENNTQLKKTGNERKGADDTSYRKHES